jgi:hypothetical protein
VSIVFFEPHLRVPGARRLDQHGAAADVNLRKVAVDQRLDLCSIEATPVLIVAWHAD